LSLWDLPYVKIVNRCPVRSKTFRYSDGQIKIRNAKPKTKVQLLAGLLLGIYLLSRVIAIRLIITSALLASRVIGGLHHGDAARLITVSLSLSFPQNVTKVDLLPRILLCLLESVLLVLITALAPVTVVTGSTTTTAAASTATTTATTATAAAILVGANVAGVDLIHLLIAVFLLGLDEELLVVELGLGVKSKEFFLLLLGLEFDEDASLEDLLGVSPAETNGVDRTVGLEKSLNISLSSRSLLAKSAETLSIDAAGHGTICEDLGILVTVNLDIIRQGSLALDGGIVVGQVQGLGSLHGLNNGAEGLEAAHALEGVEQLQRDGVVRTAADLGEEEFVHGKVGVGEVELNL